ncbi:hypothetical protein GCM10010423_77020 [Streptomyces levis]|uniref:Uncharacterized protein n=1 Tax=Streptomyces levis TaxID=285566 RepID=A0ABP6BGB5_9ACTN
MSHEPDRDHSGKQPETALEEVLREIEDAETRTEDSAAQRRHRGEAGDATSPNTGAQEQAEGD